MKTGFSTNDDMHLGGGDLTSRGSSRCPGSSAHRLQRFSYPLDADPDIPILKEAKAESFFAARSS